MRSQNIPATNLDKIWQEVVSERQDPEIAKRRRLEALLGREPSDKNVADVERLLEGV